MNRISLLAASASVFAACAGGNPVQAADASAPGALAPAVKAPSAETSALPNGQLRTGAQHHLALTTSRAVAEVLRIDAANRAAVREPERDAYLNAVQVYPWSEGAIYRLYTAPERVSEIALQPGEALISVAAGDTVRWVIGDTTSGSGSGRRTHILVKPSAAGLETNLVITTDRRVYRVEVESNARSSMAGISWTYPQDALLALNRAEAAAAAAQPVAEGVAVEALNFDYSIGGDQPSWRPIRAFDDGRQVFIQFPASLGHGEAPPLFIVGQSGRSELVNYRLRGLYYVVDRLFSVAELRLGERRQQVVRITRSGDGRQRRARP
jgi:type IV secretion system protein VirB9